MAKTSPKPNRWPRVLRPLAARPNLVTAVAAGVAVFGLGVFFNIKPVTGALLGWDAGVALYLGLIFRMMSGAEVRRMKARAIEEDEGGAMILLLSIGAAVASVAAIGFELVTAKDTDAAHEAAQVALTFCTIALSWTFVHIVFALRYAHLFYLGKTAASAHAAGLKFPSDETPDYWDFVHFALVIGAAAQTADIEIVSKRMRRLATAHTLIAFTFNTAILAVMINLVAGLAD